MSRYKIATKTDTLRYKIAKEVFGEIEDSDGVRDIPSWEIFEKCLEQQKQIAILEKALELAVGQLDDAKDMLRECGKHEWASMLDTSADYFKARAKEMKSE